MKPFPLFRHQFQRHLSVLTGKNTSPFFSKRVTASTKDDDRIHAFFKGPLSTHVGPTHHAAFRSIETVFPLQNSIDQLKEFGYTVLRQVPLGLLNTAELRHHNEFKPDGSGIPYIFLSSIHPKVLPESAHSILDHYLPLLSHPVGVGIREDDLRLSYDLPITFSDYHTLKSTNQYTAWTLTNLMIHNAKLLAKGESPSPFALNHWAYDTTLTYPSLHAFHSLAHQLERHDLGINEQNGRFQEDHIPSESYYFGQFSTLSSAVNVTFSCGTPSQIPGTYVEFTRIDKPTDTPFKGFRQAQHLFSSTESTHQKKNDG